MILPIPCGIPFSVVMAFTWFSGATKKCSRADEGDFEPSYNFPRAAGHSDIPHGPNRIRPGLMRVPRRFRGASSSLYSVGSPVLRPRWS